jgi:hypothetical protein
MAETLLFSVPAPTVDEEPAVNIHWYQSMDGLTWGSVAVASAVIADLAFDTAKGKYIFPAPDADPVKYSQLKTESASGMFCPFGAIVPPRPAGTDMCLIIADVMTFGLQAKEGIEFSLSSKSKVLHRYLVDGAMLKQLTDVDGRVSFNVMAGGVYEMGSTIIGRPITIDTTGQVLVNVADVIDPP